MSKSLNRPAEGPQSGALRPQLASRVGTYIICKQEEANLRKSLPVLSKLGYPIYLFDSGSTDGTHSLIKEFDQVYLISYDYTDHCSAYNHITLTSDHEYALILDADMVPTEQLSQELKNKLE